MGKLVMKNEMTMAVGNVKVNARGDELGPGGKIIKKREDALREVAPKSTPQKNVTDMDPEGKE
jgi:hypothetical protein